MKIVVNDVAASHGGALTLLESFHRYLRESDDPNEWYFLVGGDFLEEFPRLHTIVLPGVKKSWLRRLLFDLISGRRLVARLNPAIVLSLQNTVIWGVDAPQVLYVHQPLPFQSVRNYSLFRKDERLLATYQHVIGRLIKASARRADRVIVQTGWMRTAITDQIGLHPRVVEVIPPDLNDMSCLGRSQVTDRRQFLYPTADLNYKNNKCVEEACKILVDQGTIRFQMTMTIDGSSAPNVHAVGRVPRSVILSLLARSTLVFPSVIETFGLPLLEARALGVLVLAADLPYAREVLHGYENAYFFDPNSPGELAALMKKVIEGEVVRLSPCEPSVQGEISWSKIIRVLADVARAAG